MKKWASLLKTLTASGTLLALHLAFLPAAQADWTLLIVGNPTNFSTPVPLRYGSYTTNSGISITNSVPGSTTTNGAKWGCLGWTLTETGGAEVSTSTSTRAVFQMTTNLTLTWNWTNASYLSITANINGTASTSLSGWYTNGALVQIGATADVGYVFLQWTGDVPTGDRTNNPLTLLMDQPRAIKAQFATNMPMTRTWNWSGNWFTATNWTPQGIPGTEDTIYINSGTNVLTDSVNVAALTITNATLTFVNWMTQLRVASDVTIRNKGVMTCVGGFENNAMSNRVAVTCSNLTILPGGSINVNSCGYRQGTSGSDPAHGPGASGSHGGMASGPVYGTAELADLTGSGGNGRTAGYSFSGSAGGGAAWVQADGTVRVDGSILASAANSTEGGGGSGGGIHIECQTIEGIGTVSANSGASGPYHKGGGGGRIAVLFNAAAQAATPKPRVTFSARGSTGGAGDGDIGTLYFPTMDLLDPSWMPHSGQLFLGSWTVWRGNTFNVTNGWLRLPAEGSTFLITNTLSIMGASARLETRNTTVNCGDFVLNDGRLDLYVGLTGTVFECANNFLLTNGATMLFYASITNNTTPPYGALLKVGKKMVIATNSWLYPYSNQTNGGSPLFRVSNLLVAGGGGINADAKGYAGGAVRGPGFGPGKGSNDYSGAGYGGTGGRNGGQPYGSSNAPVDCGSGAYLYVDVGSSYGRGGGLIRIEAEQTVTIDGILTANGYYGGVNANGGNGGGSGGGIYVTATRFEGNTGAVVRADGGDGATNSASRVGGGGGGGRIAIWSKYCTYSGTTSVTNGDGYVAIPATVGTIVWGQQPFRGTSIQVK